jgi:hypothetical protein
MLMLSSHQPFSGRLKVERGVFANVLFLALDPVFVRRVAEGLELDSDRVELIEKRRSTDPTLHHIAMALRAGVQSGAALDRMYGEALSTALAVHLLREYGAAVLLTASASARELGFLVLPSNSTKGLIQEPLRRFKYAIFEGDRKDDHMLPNAVSTPKR